MTTITDPTRRTQTPRAAGEQETLLALLAFQRDTLRLRCSGLTEEQLAHQHEPSTLTLRGLLQHLAVVELAWMDVASAGGVELPVWARRDGGAEGWTFDARESSREELFARLDESQRTTERVVGAVDRSALGEEVLRDGQVFTLRWILLHLVQEYGRHLGHADLIREAIDGATGV